MARCVTVTTKVYKPRNTMARRLRDCREPGVVILRATRKRLMEQWDAARESSTTHIAITAAILEVDLCLSRVRSDLVV